MSLKFFVNRPPNLIYALMTRSEAWFTILSREWRISSQTVKDHVAVFFAIFKAIGTDFMTRRITVLFLLTDDKS